MKIFLQIILYCCVGSAFAYTDSTSLQQHRRNNDLESWIYARIAYVEKDPATRIDFLMRTQQQAWRSYQTYRERLVWFDLLSLQGYYQLQTGNILSSINAYESALSFYEAYPLPDADIIETVLKPLGNNYTRLADYKTALFIHRKTLALAADKATRASVYTNMAICARWQGHLQEAIGYCQTAVRFSTSTNGLLLSTWADILSEQNRYDTAEILCKQALRFNNPSWHAGTLQIAAKIALRQGKHKHAIAYGKEAMQLYWRQFPASRWREKAKLHVLMGDVYLAMRAAAEAYTQYQQALSLLLPSWQPAEIPTEASLYGENTIADALSGKAAALEALQQPQAALNNYLASFMAERKLRSAFFYAESKLRELQVTRPRVEAAMKLAYKLKDEQRLLLIAEISRAQVLMDERRWRMRSISDTIQRLQSAITYYQHELLNNPQAASLLHATEHELSLLQKKPDEPLLTIPQLQGFIKQLPANVTVLEFFAGRDSSFIIELTQKGIHRVHRIANDTIHPFMQQWFANGPANMINSPKQFYQACHRLYSTIFSNHTWQAKTHYLVMPDGLFNYLPFDALITDSVYHNNFSQWPYLCKQARLSQAYSLQTWSEQQSMSYATTSFTAFFISKGQPLAVEKECKALQRQIAGQFYLNETATRAAFNTHADSAGILHISTHAISSANDSFPYLQLYDKPFYLFDLRYKHFAPSLVVLGACKTADGVLLEGEGLNSLSRAFTAAGAGAVVSGLWNVHDQAAIAMMQDFYSQLPKQHNAAMALYAAREQWLKTEHKNSFLLLPYYWAGFVYSGHLKNVEIKTAHTATRWYWLAGILIALPLLLWTVKKRT